MKVCFPNCPGRVRTPRSARAGAADPFHYISWQPAPSTASGSAVRSSDAVFLLPGGSSHFAMQARTAIRWRSQPHWNSRTCSSFPDSEISLDENLPWCFKQTALHREASTRSRGFRLTATCTSNPSGPQGTIGPTKGLATERARLYACRAPTMSRRPFT